VRTFIRKLDPGPFTEQLLDELQVRLASRAIVGRLELPEAIPVFFFDEPGVEDQRAAVVAALNAVDRAAGRQPGEWEGQRLPAEAFVDADALAAQLAGQELGLIAHDRDAERGCSALRRW
jgi:hypothetical protein